MGFVLLGLMTLGQIGLSGAVLQMFSHGILAGLLFAVVGRMVYDRTHTRDLDQLEKMSLYKVIPFAAVTFVIAGMASIGLPGFSGFVAELQILIGAWRAFPLFAVGAGFGIVIGVAYTWRAMQKAFFGTGEAAHEHALPPISLPERIGAVFLICVSVIMGLYPQIILNRVITALDSPLFDGLRKGRLAMIAVSYSELLRLALPEVIVVVAALLILTIDLFAMRGAAIRARFAVGSAIACFGCGGAIACLLIGPQVANVFGGTLVLGPQTELIQIALLVLTILVVLLAIESTFTPHVSEFLALILFATASMMFLVSSQNILLIFISLELLSLSLYVLTAFKKRSARSAGGGAEVLSLRRHVCCVRAVWTEHSLRFVELDQPGADRSVDQGAGARSAAVGCDGDGGDRVRV